MRYFEVILDRHLINLYHKNKREDEKTLMLINEATVNEQIAYEEPKEETKIDVKLGSKLEELIYLYYYIEGKSVNYLSKKLKLSKKQVYNGIYRVKRKLSEQLKEEDKNLLIKK
jgi:DNA-directed RNA polymerase specialized sigma24 family protein